MAMTFFCNKCGYSGGEGPFHRLRHVDAPCPYMAVECPPLSEADREKIRKQFGLPDPIKEEPKS